MKNRRPAPRGFTLLEIILAMGLSFFLMAALYQAIGMQSKFAEISQAEIRQPLLARTLLHRMAEELRSLTPPGPPEPATTAKALLSLGETAATPASETEMIAPKVERFALLGTSDRLMLRTCRLKSPMAQAFREKDEKQAKMLSSLDRAKERPPAPGDVQICFYLLKPVPEKKQNEAVGAPLDAENNTDAESAEPLFLGLIRQEILNPFAIDAFAEAKEQLEPLLSTEPPDESKLDAKDEKKESPAADVVHTRVVADDVTAVKYRYHDGSGWRDRWDQPDRLPVAVEISVSFNPRASDPEFLKDQTKENTAVATDAASPEPAATTAKPGEEESEPLFPYRLVVAIPTAQRPLRSPSAMEDRFGRPPAPPLGEAPP